MDKNRLLKEVGTILLASIILAISFSFLKIGEIDGIFMNSFYSMLIIITFTFLVKKAYAYYLEADVKVKFWSMENYGFRKKAHFVRPLPMVWLPLLFAPLGLKWFGILETEIVARTERVSKRHGLYRFSEMTDWHVALICTAGIIASMFLAITSYILGFETFSKMSILFMTWSIIPVGSLDGTKIFFGNRFLWTTLASIIAVIFFWGLFIS
jgi:hypothetical protein